MTLPNVLALLRAALAVAVAALLVSPEPRHGIAAALFALAVASDVADGALARLRREQSPAGAFLDAAADKLLVLGVLVPVTLGYPYVAPLVALLVGRDLVVTWRRADLLRRGATLRVTPLAKLKTALLFTGCELYLVSLALHSVGGVAVAGACVIAGSIAALLSAAQYLTQRPHERASG